MPRYLLDTSLCLRVIGDRPSGLRPGFNAEGSSLCISDLVLYELLYGAEKPARPAENRHVVERFAARPGILAYDSGAAAHVADIRASHERRGRPMGAIS